MLRGSSDPKQLARLLAVSQVGFEMVAPIVLGLAADYYFGLSPWCLIVGLFVGLVGGVAHLVVISQQLQKPTAAGKPPEGR